MASYTPKAVLDEANYSEIPAVVGQFPTISFATPQLTRVHRPLSGERRVAVYFGRNLSYLAKPHDLLFN
jgi:hypothetical protein